MNPSQKIFDAHEHSSNNKEELSRSSSHGCFYCLSINNKPIEKWIETKLETTALCPDCAIDCVIGDASGYPITEEFLQEMCDWWFGNHGFIKLKG